MTNPPSRSGVKMANRPPVNDFDDLGAERAALRRVAGSVPDLQIVGQRRARRVVGEGVAGLVEYSTMKWRPHAPTILAMKPRVTHLVSHAASTGRFRMEATPAMRIVPRMASTRTPAPEAPTASSRPMPDGGYSGDCPDPTLALHNNSKSLVAMSQERRSKGSVSSSVRGIATSWSVFSPGHRDHPPSDRRRSLRRARGEEAGEVGRRD